jgi:hypothetical protein
MSAMVSSKLDHRSFPPFYNNLELLLLLLLACTHDKNDDNEEEVRNTPHLLS